jgi:hypothetical protein
LSGLFVVFSNTFFLNPFLQVCLLLVMGSHTLNCLFVTLRERLLLVETSGGETLELRGRCIALRAHVLVLWLRFLSAFAS